PPRAAGDRRRVGGGQGSLRQLVRVLLLQSVCDRQPPDRVGVRRPAQGLSAAAPRQGGEADEGGSVGGGSEASVSGAAEDSGGGPARIVAPRVVGVRGGGGDQIRARGINSGGGDKPLASAPLGATLPGSAGRKPSG